MRKVSVAAGIAIAVFGALCFTAIFVATSDPAPGAQPLPPIAVAAASPRQVATPAPVAAPPSPSPSPSSGVPRHEGGSHAARRSVSRDPSQAPQADRVTRKAVQRALSDPAIQTRLARCVDRDVGFGATPGFAPRGRPPSLMLQLETRSQDVLIAGVAVARWGEASDATASCAGNALRGTVVNTSTRQPGLKVEMPYTLNPRTETLAARR